MTEYTSAFTGAQIDQGISAAQAALSSCGLLISNGQGNINAALPGQDFQPPTCNLHLADTLAADDMLPLYDASNDKHVQASLEELRGFCQQGMSAGTGGEGSGCTCNPADYAAAEHSHAALKSGGFTATLPQMSANCTLAISSDIPAASSALPQMNGAAATGQSASFARADHVHPADVAKADKVSSATPGNLAALDSSGNLLDSGYSAADLAAAGSSTGSGDGLTEDTTVYVNTTGSDSTGDGSAAQPWATIQHAVDMCPVQGSYEYNIMLDASSAKSYAGAYIPPGKSIRLLAEGSGAITITPIFRQMLLPINEYVHNAGFFVCGKLRILFELTVDFTAVSEGRYGIAAYYGGVCSVMANIAVTGGQAALYTSNSGVIDAKSVAVNDVGYVARCLSGGRVTIAGTITGTVTSIQLAASSSGMIQYNANNATGGTATSVGNGGRIYGGAQTNVPNY